jgi:hypothetical protein
MEDGMAIRLDEALRWALVRTRAQADCFRHPGQFRAESRGRQEWFVTRLCGAAAHQIRNCREAKSQDRPEVCSGVFWLRIRCIRYTSIT